ncbi:hypothetical protein BN3590_02148 [Clostridium sp. C105KSO15]|nr:hypothetical protein BN3590_02148 [Clostridium sp. C105KSO15]
MNEQFEQDGKYPLVKVGDVTVTSGRLEIGDPLCYMNSPYSCTLEQLIEPGRYPVYLSVMEHAVFGPKYLTAKLEISKEPPVRYEMAMPKGYSIEDKDKPGVLALFGVDTGMACICDKETSVTFDAFLKNWRKKNPEKNHYDDYFADLMRDFAEKHPDYQRQNGDYFEFKVPQTEDNLIMFTSAFGDGAYSSYWGYNEAGKILCLVIPFIHPESFDVTIPKLPKQKDFFLESEKIKPLIESDLFCIATDRIMVDGCKVGYMMRQEPQENEPQDSGWVFYEGTEDEAYMDDSSHMGIYSLNTVANYDSDIIPHLKVSVGIALFRGADGKFYVDRGEV